MTEEQVERVAEAVYLASINGPLSWAKLEPSGVYATTCRKVARAAIAALDDGWQDIASAPRDEVLLFFPRIVSGAHRQNVLPAMYRVGRVSDTPNRKPSHFRLLPPPPGAKP